MSDEIESTNIDPSRWQKLNEMFAAALDLAPEQQREFLEKHYGADEGLQREAAAILAATRVADRRGFLSQDALSAGAHTLALNEVSPGAVVAGYRVIREIGRGGMGAVYLAVREEFNQQVALKIIKRGMDTDLIIRRFVRERDVLASLNHPNIARLLDGGHTADGLPFIAMEYVQGEAITEFCDRNRLTIEDRIQLFRKVCSAVAYAHQNLVVHRDLKPSNILIGADSEPKLLDFGIAKLLSPNASEATIDLTVTGAQLMTPDYASPEQIRGERVTTVSDVYSLGVLLYELLCGRRPFQLKNRPPAEMLRIISDQEPSSPSTAALTKAEALVEDETKRLISPQTVANSRKEQPARLCKRLRGDLDNIVLKALRKDPQRRYNSVERFSEDLQRHLLGLPVVARPATFAYQVSKFVQRNRRAVALLSFALVALLTGFSVALWQARVARQERSRAQQESERSKQQAAESRRLANSLLTDYANEIGDLAGSYPVRLKLMKATSDYLDQLSKATNDPAVLRDLGAAHARLGQMYGFHMSEEAERKRHIYLALELIRRALAITPDDPVAKKLLASTLLGIPFRFDGSEQSFLEGMQLLEQIVTLNPTDQASVTDLADAYLQVGQLLRDFHRPDEALTYFKRALATRQNQIASLEKSDLSVEEYDAKFWAYAWIGLSQGSDFHDWQTALGTLGKGTEVVEAAALRFPTHQRTQTNVFAAHNYLARAFNKTGDYRNALTHYRIALDSLKKSSSRFNMFTNSNQAMFRIRIAEMLAKTGQTEPARQELREALRIQGEAFAVNHANPRIRHAHGDTLLNAAQVFLIAGSTEEALAAAREAEQTLKAMLDNGQNQTAIYDSLAHTQMVIGDIYANCSPEGFDIKQTNPRQLRAALEQYKLSLDSYSKRNSPISIPEKYQLAQNKLTACEEKLTSRSPTTLGH